MSVEDGTLRIVSGRMGEDEYAKVRETELMPIVATIMGVLASAGEPAGGV